MTRLQWALAITGLTAAAGAAVATQTDVFDGLGRDKAPPRIAIALSGGGYRASIFAIAALKAIEQQGLGGQVVAVSGVSGGGLVAAHYVADRAAGRTWADTEVALIDRLSSVELARSVIAAELASAGDAMAISMADCLWKKLKSVATSPSAWFSEPVERTKKALKRCSAAGARALEGASLATAIHSFTGSSCLADGVGISQCVARGPKSVGASIVAMAGALVGGEDVQPEILKSFCGVLKRRCSGAGPDKHLQADFTLGESNPTDAVPGRRPHPFADLLHMAFLPKATAGPDLRIGDLAGPADRPAPLLILGGTSTRSGDLWAVTQGGAGTLEEHGPADGPRGFDRFGEHHPRGIRVADALAASACYPLVCRPVAIRRPGVPASEEHLTDGGVHDNLAVRQLYALRDHHGGPDWDVLIVVDAHRRATPPDPSVSRVGTLLRLHDLMHEQQAEVTLQWARTREDSRKRGLFGGGGSGCELLHLPLATLVPNHPLATMPTDLRTHPKGQLNGMVDAAQAAIGGRLTASACLAN